MVVPLIRRAQMLLLVIFIILVAVSPAAYAAESEGACGNPEWSMSPPSSSPGDTVTLSEEVPGGMTTGDAIKGVFWDAELATESRLSHTQSFVPFNDDGPGIMSYSFTVPLDAGPGPHTVSLRLIWINPPAGTPSGIQVVPGNCRVFNVVDDTVSRDAYPAAGAVVVDTPRTLPNTGLSFLGFLAAGLVCLFSASVYPVHNL